MANPNIFPQHTEGPTLVPVTFSGRGDFGPGWENNPEYASELDGEAPLPRDISQMSIKAMQSFLDGTKTEQTHETTEE